MPKIIFKRKREWVNMSDVYTIFVNGKKKKKLARGGKEVLKVKRGKHKLRAAMDNFGSPEISLKLKRGDTAEVYLSGFQFQEYILPYFGAAIPVFFILRGNELISPWWALPIFLPAGAYAAYHYFIRTDKYIRIGVKKKKSKKKKAEEKQETTP